MIESYTYFSGHFRAEVLRSCSSLESSLEALTAHPLPEELVAAGLPAAAAIAIDSGIVMNWGWEPDEEPAEKWKSE